MTSVVVRTTTKAYRSRFRQPTTRHMHSVAVLRTRILLLTTKFDQLQGRVIQQRCSKQRTASMNISTTMSTNRTCMHTCSRHLAPTGTSRAALSSVTVDAIWVVGRYSAARCYSSTATIVTWPDVTSRSRFWRSIGKVAHSTCPWPVYGGSTTRLDSHGFTQLLCLLIRQPSSLPRSVRRAASSSINLQARKRQ